MGNSSERGVIRRLARTTAVLTPIAPLLHPTESAAQHSPDSVVAQSVIGEHVSVLQQQPFFTRNQYGDCPTDGKDPLNIWTDKYLDCAFGEPGNHPSLEDEANFPNNAAYWRHNTPTAVHGGDTSISSMNVGLSEQNGTEVLAVSFYFHPREEAHFINTYGQERRVRGVMEPFLEFVAGRDIDTQTARDLYDAGVHCGNDALDGQDWGRGTRRSLGGGIIAQVEISDRTSSSSLSMIQQEQSGGQRRDCNVRVAKVT